MINKKRRKIKKRNQILAAVAKNDPTRYRQRIVESNKSKSKKRIKTNTRSYLSDQDLFYCYL